MEYTSAFDTAFSGSNILYTILLLLVAFVLANVGAAILPIRAFSPPVSLDVSIAGAFLGLWWIILVIVGTNAMFLARLSDDSSAVALYDHSRPLVGWSLVTTVSMTLLLVGATAVHALTDRPERLLFPAVFLWSVATYYVTPTIIFERTSLQASLRKNATRVRHEWKTILVAQAIWWALLCILAIAAFFGISAVILALALLFLVVPIALVPFGLAVLIATLVVLPIVAFQSRTVRYSLYEDGRLDPAKVEKHQSETS